MHENIPHFSPPSLEVQESTADPEKQRLASDLEKIRSRIGDEGPLAELVRQGQELLDEPLPKENPEESAQYVVRLLAYAGTFDDATAGIEQWRPQDAADHNTTGSRLGLSQDEAALVTSEIVALPSRVQDYCSACINKYLGGDFSMLARHLQTAGEAYIFHQLLLHVSRSKNEERTEDVQIHFADGTPSIDDSLDAIDYLIMAPRELALASSRFDPEPYALELSFLTRGS